MFEISYTPADGSGKLTTEVFEFTGTGGVTMGMYNTDEVTFQCTDPYVWFIEYPSWCSSICSLDQVFNNTAVS